MTFHSKYAFIFRPSDGLAAGAGDVLVGVGLMVRKMTMWRWRFAGSNTGSTAQGTRRRAGRAHGARSENDDGVAVAVCGNGIN